MRKCRSLFLYCFLRYPIPYSFLRLSKLYLKRILNVKESTHVLTKIHNKRQLMPSKNDGTCTLLIKKNE